MLRRLDDHAATVVCVWTARDVPGGLEPIERERQAAGGHPHRPGECRRGGRPNASEDVEAPEVAAIDAKATGGPLVQPIDLGREPAHRRADGWCLVLA